LWPWIGIWVFMGSPYRDRKLSIDVRVFVRRFSLIIAGEQLLDLDLIIFAQGQWVIPEQ
jgi:hypothetical protein